MEFTFIGLQDFLQYDFLQYAVYAVVMMSLLSGLLSPFILAKKYSFMGEGISHSTLVGLSLAYGFFAESGPLTLFLWTLIPTLLLVLALAYATFDQKLPPDSLIGIYLSSSLALGVLLNQAFSKQKGDLLSFLFGNLLFLSKEDLVVMGLLVLGLLLFFGLTFQQWVFITFDPLGAKIAGLKVKLYHYLFFIFMAFYIVVSIKLVGTVLMNTLLLIPGALAYKLARNMRELFTYSILFSLLSSLSGLVLSNWKNLPIGATLALTQFSFFCSLLFLVKIIKSFKKS